MIADGLREHHDYKICEKRFAVKILLTFYDSPLADNQTQVTACLNIFCILSVIRVTVTAANGN